MNMVVLTFENPYQQHTAPPLPKTASRSPNWGRVVLQAGKFLFAKGKATLGEIAKTSSSQPEAQNRLDHGDFGCKSSELIYSKQEEKHDDNEIPRSLERFLSSTVGENIEEKVRLSPL